MSFAVTHGQVRLDPLSVAVLALYPDGKALCSVACLAVLEALASQWELDIASVEAAHATSREFTKLRSRGWTPSLEAVSAKFTQRMSSWASRAENVQSRSRRRRQEKPRRRSKHGGKIGGGAWRVFVHEQARG